MTIVWHFVAKHTMVVLLVSVGLPGDLLEDENDKRTRDFERTGLRAFFSIFLTFKSLHDTALGKQSSNCFEHLRTGVTFIMRAEQTVKANGLSRDMSRDLGGGDLISVAKWDLKC